MKNAFSLIELSIVLIIIGLLVAGVTGGASLIQSAKLTSMVNEIRNLDMAVKVFYAAKGRLPGDLANSGKIGNTGGLSFPAPYDVYPATSRQAPFVDLTLEKILDSDLTNVGAQGFYDYQDKTFPKSKPFNDYFYYYTYIGTSQASSYLEGIRVPGNYLTIAFNDSYYGGAIGIGDEYEQGLAAFNERMLRSKQMVTIDNKLDDGVNNTGKFRANCDYSDPKNKCSTMYYDLGL